MDNPWISIIGVGEDGLAGFCAARQEALSNADLVFGPPRHLELVGVQGERARPWPVPFANGIDQVLAERGRGKQIAVLLSGDPFWFGGGTTLTHHLQAEEWVSIPAPSTFSWAASRLGWALQSVVTLGLHARPFETLVPHLAPDMQVIVTLRHGAAVGELAQWLTDQGFGHSTLHVLEALGGPNERIRVVQADEYALKDVTHPVCAGITFSGADAVMTHASGRRDDLFDHDGQITKRPVRALTLSALAPRPNELLWDLGAGSGSIAIEWLLSHPSLRAIAVERDETRAKRIRANADMLGVAHLDVRTGAIVDTLGDLEAPDVVFIGGGFSHDLVNMLWPLMPDGARLVANSVTLESDADIMRAQSEFGGDLLRVELSAPKAIGSRTGWAASYPIMQWSVTK